MTQDTARLAHALLDAAIRAGAESADAMATMGTSVSIDVREGALEQAERSEGTDIGLRVLIGQQQACVSISDTRAEAIAAEARDRYGLRLPAGGWDVLEGFQGRNLSKRHRHAGGVLRVLREVVDQVEAQCAGQRTTDLARGGIFELEIQSQVDQASMNLAIRLRPTAPRRARPLGCHHLYMDRRRG